MLTLSPGSPGVPGGPDEPGAPGRPYFKQDLFLYTYIKSLYINNTIQRNSHICLGKVLSVLLQSGHTWGKEMHEAIWDSVLGCKSSDPLFICPQYNA